RPGRWRIATFSRVEIRAQPHEHGCTKVSVGCPTRVTYVAHQLWTCPSYVLLGQTPLRFKRTLCDGQGSQLRVDGLHHLAVESCADVPCPFQLSAFVQ